MKGNIDTGQGERKKAIAGTVGNAGKKEGLVGGLAVFHGRR